MCNTCIDFYSTDFFCFNVFKIMQTTGKVQVNTSSYSKSHNTTAFSGPSNTGLKLL